jgi:hypothetical protein
VKRAEEAEKDGGHHVMMLEVGSPSWIAQPDRRQRAWASLLPSVRWVMPVGSWRGTAAYIPGTAVSQEWDVEHMPLEQEPLRQ